MLFIGLKYLAVAFLVAIFASFAEANDLVLSSALIKHPTSGAHNRISSDINTGCFSDHFSNLTSASACLHYKDRYFGSVDDHGAGTAITLHKHGEDVIWSLAPSLSKFSLDPLDVIKNVQVLLQYRF